MTARHYQPGDAVEWEAMGKTIRGVVESIGKDKNEGLAMVREIGQAKSRPISVGRLRDRKSTTPAAIGGGGDAA